MQGTKPARVGEEVQDYVAHPGDLVRRAGLVFLLVGGFEGPVVEEGPAHDVFAGHESPEAGVGAPVAVVAHHEVLTIGDDEVAVLHVV